MNSPHATLGHAARRNVLLIVLGIVIAIAVPVASATVAALWSSGVIDPDPNGALVETLSSLLFPSLLFSPIGLVLIASGAGLRRALAWAAMFLLGLPLVAVVWFVAAAWLGGLAGQPL
jgi:hypothetical protein